MKILNKKIGVLLSVVLLFTVGVVGCSSQSNEQSKTEFLSIATGGTSGTYYPIGGAMAKVISDEVANTNASAQSTGASVTNTRLVSKKEVQLAIVQNDIASYAFNGANKFKNKPVKNMRGIATLYPEIIQIVVREGTGIENIKDLAGKKVAVGAPGSGVEANAKQILANFDLTYDDIEEDFLSFSEAASRLKDKQIDAAFLTAGVPTAAVMDIAATQDIKLLNFTQQQIDNLNSQYPFLTGVEVPAGTYSGQDNKVTTVALKATLVTLESMDQKLVYEITKAIFENRQQLIERHSRAEDITLETAQDGMTIPLHPGAKQYFDEVK